MPCVQQEPPLVSREIALYPQAGKNHVLLRDISKKRRCQFYICYRRYDKAFGPLHVDGIGGFRREHAVTAKHVDNHACVNNPLAHSSPSRSSFMISAAVVRPL